MCVCKRKTPTKDAQYFPSRDSAVGVLNMYLYYKNYNCFVK